MSVEPVVESIVIDAPAEEIYDLVADVGRMGEWSPEATGAKTKRDVLEVGNKFVGKNKRGLFSWSTLCTVTAADRGKKFEFLVDAGPMPVSLWTYDFEPQGDKTLVTETWVDRREGIRGLAVKGIGQALIPGSRPKHNRANMVTTLKRLKRTAEAKSKPASVDPLK